MSIWDQRVADSDALRLLAALQEQLEALPAEDADQAEQIDRATRVVRYIRQALTSTDPELVPSSLLAEFAGIFSSASAAVGNFATAHDNIAYLANANDQLTQPCAPSRRIASKHRRMPN